MTETRSVHGLSRTPTHVPPPPSRWRTRVLVPALLLAGALAVLAWTAGSALWPAPTVRTAPAVLAEVAGGAASVAVQAPGWLEPAPFPVYVHALTEGVVAEVLALEGQRVAKDEVVARLVDTDARLARDKAAAALAARQADVAAAQAELAAAQTLHERRTEPRAAVARAQARIEELQADARRAQADRTAARARAEALADELERKQGLPPGASVGAGELARLRLSVEAARADAEAAELESAAVAARQQAAAADLDAANERLELLVDETRALALARAGLAQANAFVESATAELAEADLRLARTQVRAPIAGVVLRRVASPGTQVRPGTEMHGMHVVHLYDPAHLQARIDVPLADAARVGVGQAAEITVETLPDRRFAAEVVRLVHEADVAKNTVEVKVELRETDPVLRPEMLVRARFLAVKAAEGATRTRLVAPRAGIRTEGGAAVAFVFDGPLGGTGRARRRELRLGSPVGEAGVEVEDGLRPGERLVLDPPPDLADGDRVRAGDDR